MGTLVYGTGGRRVDFDDRVLAHLKSVVITKLRRNESFTFTWCGDDALFVSVWLHPSVPVQFEFEEDGVALNRAWLEQMLLHASVSGDLRITPEPLPKGA